MVRRAAVADRDHDIEAQRRREDDAGQGFTGSDPPVLAAAALSEVKHRLLRIHHNEGAPRKRSGSLHG